MVGDLRQTVLQLRLQVLADPGKTIRKCRLIIRTGTEKERQRIGIWGILNPFDTGCFELAVA